MLIKREQIFLIISMLSYFLAYFLSLFPLHVWVPNRMENFQRDFLWGCMGEKFKFTLVKWNVCCTLICVGGSRITKVYIYQALLGKWFWWCRIKENDELWRRVIDVKYGITWWSWCFDEVRGQMVWVCGRILEEDKITYCIL